VQGIHDDQSPAWKHQEWKLTQQDAAGGGNESDALPWTAVDASEDVAGCRLENCTPALTLRPNVLYRCMWRTTNLAGSTSAVVASDGWTFDDSAPQGGVVSDGSAAGNDDDYTSSTVELPLTWTPFMETDYHNESVTYEVGLSLCSQPGPEKWVKVNVSTAQTYTIQLNGDGECAWLPRHAPHCTLHANQTYCAHVRATNKHGLSNASRSDGVRVCPEPLRAGTVTVAGLHLNAVGRNQTVTAHWYGFHTTASACAPLEQGRHAYELRLRRWNGSAWVMEGQNEPLAAGVLSKPLSVTAEGEFRVEVCAFNLLDLVSCAESAVFVVDATPPQLGPWCFDGSCREPPPPTFHLQPGRSLMLALETACDNETGFACSWAVERPAGSDVGETSSPLPGAPPLLSTFTMLVTPERLGLSRNGIARLNLTCTNEAGLASTKVSPWLTLDETPPVARPEGLVTDGTSSLDMQGVRYFGASSVVVRWGADVLEDEESGLISMQLHIASRPSSAVDPVSVNATGRQANASGWREFAFEARPNVEYTATLTGTNGAGMVSAAVRSRFSYDATAPALLGVRACDTSNATITRLSAAAPSTTIRICLSGLVAPPSGIKELVLTVVRPSDSKASYSALAACDTFSALIMIECGAEHLLSVRARSGVGFLSDAANTSLLIECGQPLTPIVRLPTAPAGLANATWCVRAGEPVAVAWSGATDLDCEFGLARANDSVHHAPLAFKGRADRGVVHLPVEPPGAAFRPVVRCRSAAGQWSADGLSELMVRRVESKPTAGSVELISPLAGYVSDIAAVRGRYTGFTSSDGGHPLRYETCLGTTPYGCQLQEWTAHPGPHQNVTMHGLPRRCGHAHYLAVRALDCAGQSATAASANVTLCCDTARRVSLAVLDGAERRVAFVHGNESKLWLEARDVSATCGGVHTFHFRLLGRNATQEAENGSELDGLGSRSNDVDGVLLWETKGPHDRASLPLSAFGSQCVHCTSYIVELREMDHAGLWSHTVTYQLRVDNTPPANAVLEVTCNDVPAVAGWPLFVPASASTVEVWWGAADAESIDVTYRIAEAAEHIAEATCDSDDGSAIEWRNMGARTALVRAAATAPRYFVLCACNPLGLCAKPVWSHELRRVGTAPTAGTVALRPSPGASAGYLRSCRLAPACEPPLPPLVIEWEGFASDAVQLRYDVCLGPPHLGCDAAMPPLPAPHGGRLELNMSVLRCGAAYRALVVATDAANLSVVSASAAATVCCTPPAGGSVHLVDALGATVKFAHTGSTLWVEWGPAKEVCSGMLSHMLVIAALGGAPLWEEQLDASAPGALRVPAYVVSSFQHGVAYDATLTATSHAGAVGTWRATIEADLTPPYPHQVHVRNGSAALRCLTAEAPPLVLFWDNFDDVQSGVTSYELKVSDADGRVVLGPLEVGTLPTATVAVAELAENADLQFAVRACNGAGAWGSWSEPSERVRRAVLAPPTAGVVHLTGSATNSSSIASASEEEVFIVHERAAPLSVEWSGFAQEGRALVYDVCLGTTPYGCQLRDFEPQSPPAVLDGPDRMSEPPWLCRHPHYVTVRATNCAGWSTSVASKQFVVSCATE